MDRESIPRKDPGNNFRSGQTRDAVEPTGWTKRSRDVRPARRPMRTRVPTLESRRARVIRSAPRGATAMTPSRAALARRRSSPRGEHQRRVSERRPRRGGWVDEPSVRTNSGDSPHQQSPSDAGASNPRDFAPTAERSLVRSDHPSDRRVTEATRSASAREGRTARSGLSSTHERSWGTQMGGTSRLRRAETGTRAAQGAVTSGPNESSDTKATSKGNKAQEGQANEDLNREFDGTDCSAEKSLGGPVPRQIQPMR